MIPYIKCPSCSRIISTNLDKYYEDYNNILNDSTKTKKEKERLFSNLLDKFKYKMICCRIRIMGLIPYHDIIN